MAKNDLTFKNNFEKFPELTPEIRAWIAEIIGSTIVADEKIAPQEKSYVRAIKNAFADDPQMLSSLNRILDTKKLAPASQIAVSAELAVAIFHYILKICLCDRNLAAKEIHYLHQVGNSLGIENEDKRQIFKQVIFQTKEGFFQNLREQLQQKEREWLAVMILKVIYADNRLHQKELPYLNHVADLVDNESERIKAIREDASKRSIEQMGKVQFEKKLSGRILEYLLRIVMSDQEFSPDEFQSIQLIARQLDYENKRLKKLIDLVKSDYQFLFI
ncbi:MAG: hypothetical protein HQM13_13210 [SAR324 cluster bacterium]|nr:hypothetical protein [SAR324 cluster bacterium]